MRWSRVSPERSRVQQEEYDGLTGPAARIPAETPKAVNVRLARETMEPRQTEFMSQGRHSCQRTFPSRVQSEKALDVAIYETCEDLGCESLSGGPPPSTTIRPMRRGA